jgi:hypothetical protein
MQTPSTGSTGFWQRSCRLRAREGQVLGGQLGAQQANGEGRPHSNSAAFLEKKYQVMLQDDLRYLKSCRSPLGPLRVHWGTGMRVFRRVFPPIIADDVKPCNLSHYLDTGLGVGFGGWRRVF